MNDSNKSRRVLAWTAFAASIISIPLFNFVDNKQLTENDLITIYNLILSENSYKDIGGGKGSHPSLKFKFTSTKRVFLITYEEYQCVATNIILSNFKKGDTVSIKIKRSDRAKFFETNWFNKSTKIYGLSKNEKSYLSLSCRNDVSNKWAKAATIASFVSAILSFVFALFILKPKTKFQSFSQFPMDPIFVLALVWLIIFLMLK